MVRWLNWWTVMPLAVVVGVFLGWLLVQDVTPHPIATPIVAPHPIAAPVPLPNTPIVRRVVKTIAIGRDPLAEPDPLAQYSGKPDPAAQ